MNGQIHQMQFTYSASEDRLLLRLNITSGEVFDFWLTRRYVKLIWPVLLNVLAGFGSAAPNALIKETLLAFQHDAIMAKANLSMPFKQNNDAVRPLGADPVLLGQLTIKRSPANLPVLCMHPERGQGIELVMDQTLLHSFCGLLVQAQNQTGWDLQCDVGDFTATPKPPPKYVLH